MVDNNKDHEKKPVLDPHQTPKADVPDVQVAPEKEKEVPPVTHK